MKTSDVVLGF